MKRHKRNVGARARHDEHARAVREATSGVERPPGRGSSGGAGGEEKDEAPDRFGGKGSGGDEGR